MGLNNDISMSKQNVIISHEHDIIVLQMQYLRKKIGIFTYCTM